MQILAQKDMRLQFGKKDSFQEKMSDCYLCEPNAKLEDQIRKCATRNAHQLAIREANKSKLANLKWCDIYAAQFPTIYAHEEARQRTFLTEKDLDQRLATYKGQPVCSYHSENLGWYSDGFHQEVFEDTLKKFLKGKWPNQVLQ